MNLTLLPEALECDMLANGAGGLDSATTARKLGFDVVVIEKTPYCGGTRAFSGGVLWIPGNPRARKAGIRDMREAAIRHMRNNTGAFFDEPAVSAFLDMGPEMVEFYERETEVKFIPALYPDYPPNVGDGVDIGRSILAAPYDSSSGRVRW